MKTTRAPIIAVANEKGGTGKTETSKNLAASLALAGSRVVGADCDSQADFSWGVGVDPDSRPHATFAEAIEHAMSGDPTPSEFLAPTTVEGLRVLPGGKGLAEIAQPLYQEGAAGEEWVAGALRMIAEREDVDVLVVDCPPSPGPMTIGALLVADLTIVVSNARQANSVSGARTLLDRVAALTDRGGSGQARVILQGHDERRRLHREMAELLAAEYDLWAVIAHDKAVEESPAVDGGVPLVAHRSRRDLVTAW